MSAKPVRKGNELNMEMLRKYLLDKDLMASSQGEIEVLQFSNGYSNLTYLLKTDKQEYVLRMPPKGAVKRGHDMGREYKVLSNLSQHTNKAPKTYAYEVGDEILGASFYIMEKVEGVILSHKKAATMSISAEDYLTISNSWLDSFVELHQLDYKAVGLKDLGKPDGYVERQVVNWSKQYHKAATMDIPEADFTMQWMADHMPKSYNHSLIHNDFKYDNVVFDSNSWSTVNAILDWEMCTLGDPLMDLGTSLAYWVMKEDGDMVNYVLPSPTVFEGNPSRSDLVEMYTKRSGVAIDHLNFYYAYGLFKIAVIAQQIFYRYHKGLTDNPKFATLDRVCQFLCIMAKQSIQKGRIDRLF